MLICSDETNFSLIETNNKQNNRIWANCMPNYCIEKPFHDENVLVSCAISAIRVYGPFFFEETVNQYNYLDMLQKFFWKRHSHTENYTNYYFQQDGAPSHTANMVQNWLKGKFLDKFIDTNKWPPRSPDLNPCDYFLWGYLKARVYHPLPKTISELKTNIE